MLKGEAREKIFKKFLRRLNFCPFTWSTTWGAKTSHLFLDNRIHIQQVHSWSGAKVPAGWRCATNFLPIRVITESKVGSDSEPFWNIRLLRIRRWNDSGTMILPYGVGGVPGRGEIPMSSVSNRTPVDFLFCILGSRKNEMQRRKSQKVFWGFRGSEMIQINYKRANSKREPKG